MNLTNEKLITILSEKLGKDEDWVTKELARLVKEIHAAVGKGETFSIDKFGSFKNKNGRLTFEADETFALEINYKYAGMAAIELKSPDDESGDETAAIRSTTEESESQSSDSVDEKINEDITDESVKPKTEEEKSDLIKAEPQEEADEKETEESGGRSLEEILGISVSGEAESEVGSDERIDVSKELVDKGKAAGTSEKKEKKPASVQTSAGKKNISEIKKKRPARKKSGTMITAIILAMIVVVIGLVLFIIYINKPIVEQTVESSPKQNTAIHNGSVANTKVNVSSETKQPLKASAMSENNNNSDNSMNGSNTRQKSDVNVSNKIINELSASSTYGLKGKLKPEVKSFYTIVVLFFVK